VHLSAATPQKQDLKQGYYDMASSAEPLDVEPVMNRKSPIRRTSTPTRSPYGIGLRMGGLAITDHRQSSPNKRYPGPDPFQQDMVDDLMEQTMNDIPIDVNSDSDDDPVSERDGSTTPVPFDRVGPVDLTPSELVEKMQQNLSAHTSSVVPDVKEIEQPPLRQSGLNENGSQSLHSEFDPLIPKDWMMSFDSPSVPRNDSGMFTNTEHVTAPSLLDVVDPVASPRSILKYSIRDVDEMKKELQSQVWE
jgi:hypothetical protein